MEYSFNYLHLVNVQLLLSEATDKWGKGLGLQLQIPQKNLLTSIQ